MRELVVFRLPDHLGSSRRYPGLRRGAAFLLLAALLGACARDRTSNPPEAELWVPAEAKEHFDLEGRELWLDVELSGYTRQTLERYSDYEAQHDDPLPDNQRSIPAPSPHSPK